MITRILLAAGSLLAVVAIVVGARTAQFGVEPLPAAQTVAAVNIDVPSAAVRLAAAIRVPTISTSEDNPVSGEAIAELHAVLERLFPLVHANLRRETVNEHSLLFTWQGSDPSLSPAVFSAHQDVVPIEPGTESEWTHPPFAGAIEDGYIWGRGAIDMKQALAGVMEAAELLLAEGYQPERTILFAFGHDEEIGGRKGAAKIAEILSERYGEVEFVLDEGMLVTHGIVPGVQRPAALIGVGEKGYANLRLIAKGPGGHSSNPLPHTVVGSLGRALAEVEVNPMPARITDTTIAMFRHLASDLPLIFRAALANIWLSRPLVMNRLEATTTGNATVRTTIAPTMLSGGIKANVIPQEATALLNVRLLPGDTVEDVVQHLTEAIGDETIRVEHADANVWRSRSSVSDTSSPAFSAIAASIATVFPDALMAPGLVIGATDSRHYADVARNTYRFVPVRLEKDDLKRFHGTNERVSVEVYVDAIRFYANLMQRLSFDQVR